MLFLPLLGSAKSYKVTSPNGRLCVQVNVDKEINYTLSLANQVLIAPTNISMQLEGLKGFGKNSTLTGKSEASHRGSVQGIFYTKSAVNDNYNELTLRFREGFNLLFRLYDDGMAYRFVSTLNKEITITDEQASWTFPEDFPAYAAYSVKTGELSKQFNTPFENTYVHLPLSKLDKNRLAFLPILIDAGNGVKLCLTEAEVNHYPNMYLRAVGNHPQLQAVHAPYPKEERAGGHIKLELKVVSAENYLVKAAPKAQFPWRVVCVSEEDKDLLSNDMVYRLATPNKIQDISWIKPGKVAWDWWNCWGVYNVPFESGINTATYKAYIDFASQFGIEYVILDEGWSVGGEGDLFAVVPEIDLKEIIRYGHNKNVGIILWVGSAPFDKDMEHVCAHYSQMGVKGFKVDCINRDDARMVDFHYRAAEMAAKYHMVLDFHGTYKPAGLNRTWPNVLNFEGVCGMEWHKWAKLEDHDTPQYDVEMPFIRMNAGPLDYTQGAMLNATRKTYHPSNEEPMSQGTRCHQLALYVILYSPLNMLCDSPTHYEHEKECTDFIASVPTTWDESIPLKSSVGNFVTMARRKGNTWYIGGITNWEARDIVVDITPLGIHKGKAEVFCDGPNADKFAQDYLKQDMEIGDGKLSLHMASGGGFAMKVSR